MKVNRPKTVVHRAKSPSEFNRLRKQFGPPHFREAGDRDLLHGPFKVSAKAARAPQTAHRIIILSKHLPANSTTVRHEREHGEAALYLHERKFPLRNNSALGYLMELMYYKPNRFRPKQSRARPKDAKRVFAKLAEKMAQGDMGLGGFETSLRLALRQTVANERTLARLTHDAFTMPKGRRVMLRINKLRNRPYHQYSKAERTELAAAGTALAIFLGNRLHAYTAKI